jgi:hypothetical protein
MNVADKGEILIDVVDADYGEFAKDFIEKTGHPATVCHGPGEGHPCPVLEGAYCEHLENAHGVVFQFDLDNPVYQEVLRRYKDIVPLEIPIRVVVSDEQRVKYADLLEGLEVWRREPTAGDLDGFSAEVEAADLDG